MVLTRRLICYCTFVCGLKPHLWGSYIPLIEPSESLNMPSPKYKTLSLSALVLALFAVSYYPALALFVKKWSASEDYAHAFFIVPVIAYIIWLKREALAEHQGGSLFGLILVVLSLLFYLTSLQIQVPTLIFLTTVATIISALIYLAGFPVLKELTIPILLLFMIIPIPESTSLHVDRLSATPDFSHE